MLHYGQFCPVAQAAEIFADRWTPLILRELCFGACTFGGLLSAMPLISRTMLAQRLKELATAEVVAIEPKTRGRGYLYRLSPAGEDFRPMIEMLSVWGQRWVQGRFGPDDLDPALLMYGMRRQIDPLEIPPGRTIIRFEFRGLPKRCRGRGYWWYVIQRPEVDVCLKGSRFRRGCRRPGGPCRLYQPLARLCRLAGRARQRSSRVSRKRTRDFSAVPAYAAAAAADIEAVQICSFSHLGRPVARDRTRRCQCLSGASTARFGIEQPQGQF